MGDGLTVKERLALLQNNNKNPNLSGAMTTAASPPTVAFKPKLAHPPSSSPSPAFPALKPVPGNKPAVAAKKTPEATPGGGPAGIKPAPAGNKPAFAPPGGGPAGNKPAPAAPPAAGKPALKPPLKPWVKAAGSGQNNGQDGGGGGTAAGNPLFPKLRSVGGGGPSPPPKKPQSPSSSSSSSLSSFPSSSPSAAEAPSEGSSGGSNSDNSGTPSLQQDRPLSVMERMKALNQISADGSSSSNKETTNKPALNGVAGGGPPPSTLPKFPHSSSTAVSRNHIAVSKNHTAANGPSDNDAEALPPPPPPLKPSDIARNINKAAKDKVLRDSKQRGEGGAGNRKSSELFVRHSDGKRFRQVQVSTAVSASGDPPPAKPAKIENVDLAAFLKAYAAAKGEKICADAAKSPLPVESGEGETEETYVEAESGQSIPVATRGSIKRAKSVRVSQIPEFTEEEEEMDETYDDASSAQSPGIPEEMYDDCSSEKVTTPVEVDDPDEIYEPLDEEMPACPPVPLSPIPQDDKKKKEKDKDKDKDKDKEGKKKEKEEKEKKKKEEELKKQRTKYGLTEADEKVGDGVVKSNCRAGMLTKDLGVAKGEIVAILRMDGNPAGKWLVQNDVGKLGYVMSNNIEVSTPTIRNLMTGLKPDNNNTIVEDDPEELYEPLPDEEQDDVYEAI